MFLDLSVSLIKEEIYYSLTRLFELNFSKLWKIKFGMAGFLRIVHIFLFRCSLHSASTRQVSLGEDESAIKLYSLRSLQAAISVIIDCHLLQSCGTWRAYLVINRFFNIIFIFRDSWLKISLHLFLFKNFALEKNIIQSQIIKH